MKEIEDLDIEHYFLYLYNFIKEMKEKTGLTTFFSWIQKSKKEWKMHFFLYNRWELPESLECT